MSIRKARILYVEDEKVLSELVTESLIAKGYRVETGSDGLEGFELYENSTYDLCILDIMMPKMDGYTLAKKIRSLNDQIPILFLTAKNTASDVVEGFSSGGNDYLKKPFSMQELHARIENLIRMTTQNATPNIVEEQTINIGRFSYYPIKQELVLADEIRQLSHREHELLVLLLQSNKGVVDRRIILKKIWGDDSFFHSRNLDVYIRKLRKYFEQDDAVQIITLKGVGYRFVY